METLNEQQLQAVQFDPTAALQVVAGPGTGKTKVLVARVANLIINYHIQPQNIIVTTFTNKAATEMKQRLAQLLSNTQVNINDLIIGTFHSVCLRILSKHGHLISLNPGWKIIDEKETDKIINDIIMAIPDQIRDYATSFKRIINLCRPSKKGDGWSIHPKLVKREISRLKSLALLPDEYLKQSTHDEALAYCYTQYQLQLHSLNSLDFDDLLMFTFRLLCSHRCLPHIQHVLVDEFQDTNSIQMDLMFLLAKGNHHISRGITVVGDPDQSIYAFRNALAHNFQEMNNKCPLPCSQVVLIQNYRSSQRILDTSETLIKQQVRGRQERLPLRAQFNCDFPPVYINFPVSFIQGPSLAKEILYLKALPNLFNFDHFAILVRQRRQIKSIETALIEHRIPYKIVKGHAFWELKEITSMLNYLNCLYTDTDYNAIVASLLYPARGIGQTSATKILSLFKDHESSSSPWKILEEISSGKHALGINAKGKNVITIFIQMIQKCQSLMKANTADKETLTQIFNTLYKMSGMEKEYIYMDGKEQLTEPNLENPRHKNIQILRNFFLEERELESLPSNPNILTPPETTTQSPIKNHMRNFFNSLSLFTSSDKISSSQRDSDLPEGAVTISTIHGSKGLEWPVVFIPGCVEGIIPSIFQSDNKDDSESDSESDSKSSQNTKKPTNMDENLDEERRMFFVAQTRAKYLLYLSSVETSNNPMFGGPSRFFTPEVMKTLTDDQKALESVHNIKELYKAMDVKPIKNNPDFSFNTLVKDYSKFLENRRESMIWSGNVVRNTNTLDLSRNKISLANPISSFTTAAAIALESGQTYQKQYAPTYSPTRRNLGSGPQGQLSPVKKHAPRLNIKGSPSPTRNFAPTARNPESPTKKFAPLKLRNNIQVPPMYATPSPRLERSPKPMSFDNKVPDRVSNIQARRNVRRITSTPIQLSDMKVNPVKSEFPKSPKLEDTTAAEILHNPADMIVDNRPIISNAKTLANAIRKNPIAKVTTKKKKATTNTAVKKETKIEPATLENRKPLKNENDKTLKTTQAKKKKVKKEPCSSQVDIFSQLARAKKKAKIDNNEIIILDD
ncbi:hypothetical protein C6P45_005120 [Maudiozyma exigua]|uniref:DNA 3'-5' helicase n=1 Tax=Maudiozyma exigua TaxID=34358 RepID=A0A9P6WBQ1_MAUEX|nr:hypothetical protein C6P45_005120 [Kazachstania exigua]